jgi:hypothetical protein
MGVGKGVVSIGSQEALTPALSLEGRGGTRHGLPVLKGGVGEFHGDFHAGSNGGGRSSPSLPAKTGSPSYGQAKE